MHVKNSVGIGEFDVRDEANGAELLLPLVAGQSAKSTAPELAAGIVIGELVAVSGDDSTPLVVFPGQTGSAAVGARSVIDLHGAHIGRHVVLIFEGADL